MSDLTTPAGVLRVEVPALPEHLPGVRRTLRRWLRCTRGHVAEADVVLVANEAVTRVILRARNPFARRDPGDVRVVVTAHLRTGSVGTELVLTVTDRADRARDDGPLGETALIRGCADHVLETLDPTTLTARFTLRYAPPGGGA